MATHAPARFSRRPTPLAGQPDAAWWPRTRVLYDELADLFAAWPVDGGRISRVLYSPPDWDDHPRSVPVAGRWVKTGSFPTDDTQELTLMMPTGPRLRVRVIAPSTPADKADDLLTEISAPAPVHGDTVTTAWENEGGHS